MDTIHYYPSKDIHKSNGILSEKYREFSIY